MNTAMILFALGWVVAAIGAGVSIWAIYGDKPRIRRRCPKCFYDLANIEVPCVCSECGRKVASEAETKRTRRRWLAVRIGLALTLVGWTGGAWFPVRNDGWAAAFPDWVLAPVLPAFDRAGTDLAREAEKIGPASWTRWERLLLARQAAGTLGQVNDRADDPAAIRVMALASQSGPEFRVVAPAFAKASIESKSVWVARLGVLMLASRDPLGTPTRRAVEALATRMDRTEACEAVIAEAASVSSLDPEVTLALLSPLLASADPWVVRQAALALAELQDGARPALPALRLAEARITDEDARADVRFTIAAIEAVGAAARRGPPD